MLSVPAIGLGSSGESGEDGLGLGKWILEIKSCWLRAGAGVLVQTSLVGRPW